MKKRVTVSIFIIAILAVSALAQEAGNFPTALNEPSKSSFSLLDPSRFHMSQSYSLSYSSSKYGSQSLGMYLNSIEYQISDPLKIQVDVAYLHNPGVLIGNNSNSYLSSDGKILPGVSLTWTPSKNTYIRFDYHQYYYNGYTIYPNSLNYYDPYSIVYPEFYQNVRR